jgi:hypothetical protein
MFYIGGRQEIFRKQTIFFRVVRQQISFHRFWYLYEDLLVKQTIFVCFSKI